MSNTIHKQTLLDMLERDVENKYDYLKSNGLNVLTSLSTSIPLLKIVLPSTDKWLDNKARQFLPKVQDMVNLSVEMSFVDPEISIDDAYINAKQSFNNGLNEIIRSKSSFSLESVDQLCEILIGSKVSL